MVARDPTYGIQRRVAGKHNVRMEGLSDLLLHARGMSVLDVGCNRGAVGYEFYLNGARLVHGCDSDSEAINVARHWFADFRDVQFKFETMNLKDGPGVVRAAFGDGQYDTILLLAIVHKLERAMPPEDLHNLLVYFGRIATRYVAAHIGEYQIDLVHKAMVQAGLKKIHVSYISDEMGPGVIWARNFTGSGSLRDGAANGIP